MALGTLSVCLTRLWEPGRPPAIARQVSQRRTAMKRASKSGAWQGTRIAKFRGIRKEHGECVKAGSILVRQCGKVFYPGPNVRVGRDYSLQAECEGFVRFYWDRKHGPRQESLARRKIKRYCGLVFHPEDELPRDTDQLGRARRFSLVDKNTLTDYLRDRGPRHVRHLPYSDAPAPPTPYVQFTSEDAVLATAREKQPGPMTQREMDIADLLLKRTAVAADGLPKFNNVRRALGMPLKPVGATPLNRQARDEARQLLAPRNKHERRVERDLAFSTVSSEEMAQLRAAEGDVGPRQKAPIISTPLISVPNEATSSP